MVLFCSDDISIGRDPNQRSVLFMTGSSSKSKNEHKGLFVEAQNEVDNRSDGHILRHFFDDWPRSLQESDSTAGINASNINLSISMPGNSSSDVSLKLSTGNNNSNERDQPQLNWATGWATNQVAAMGGPLAEALRSSASNSNSSPTSVLH